MRRWLVGTGALVGAWIFTVVMYGRMDDRIPIHWNFRFEVDDYAPRIVALVIASVLLALPLLARVLSRIDPRGGDNNRDPSAYWTIWNAVMCLLAAIQFFIVATAAGWGVPVSRVLPMLIGIFFVIFGNLEPRLRANWFVGTRTPWTLTSDDVWRRTHRFGGQTSVVGGLLLIVGAWLPIEALRYAVWVCALVLIVVAPIAYSYLVWHRLGRPRATAS
jgi:uncharacterized membrane protein